MTRNSSRRTRLWSWRYLRWAIALPTLPLAWWACISHPLTQPVPEPEQQTNLYISVSPVRQLDLVFMVDNSPSMAPKVAKMNAQFPTLLTALKDPNDQTYPDLRVAIIDSDLGTGGEYSSGSCGPNADNGNSQYGDLGNFQMRNKNADGSTCGANNDALWLEYTKGQAINYDKNQDISKVFGCLAANLGTVGCGEEHQLQAFEFALIAKSGPQGIPGRNPAQDNFIRPTAYLGLVFLSDEDDCSAAPQPNDAMFGDQNHPELAGESASLRCSTRAHQCNGKNLTDSGPGYPTNATFTAKFSDCAARTDACPNTTDGYKDGTDTTNNTSCSPLKDFKHLAAELKGLKGDPDQQLLVAGIFGWPRNQVDSSGKLVLDNNGNPQPDMANATYQIDLTPNPNSQSTAHPKIYDYWPVCYDPDHLPKNGKDSNNNYNFDADAWGIGAEGGLRESAFIDEFGTNGLKYSICERDFSAAMDGIGKAIAKHLQNLCVAAKIYNTDFVNNPQPANAAALGVDCRVVYRDPQVGSDGKTTYVERTDSLHPCDKGATNGKVDQDCWQLTIDHDKCKGTSNGQLIQVLRTGGELDAGPLAQGTEVSMQCRTCPDDLSSLSPASDSYKACSYQPLP